MNPGILFAAAMLGALISADALAAECSLPADAQAGKTVSNACKACHVFEADKPSRVTGPNLHDMFGAVAGSRVDFPKYSEGMTGAHDKGVKWTEDNLFAYVGDPKSFLDKVNGKEVPHAMAFKLADEQKRKDLIAFLEAIAGKPECN